MRKGISYSRVHQESWHCQAVKTLYQGKPDPVRRIARVATVMSVSSIAAPGHVELFLR